MDPPLRVLHLEDDVRDAELLQATLEEEGIRSELTRVEAEQDFISALKGGRFDLILADYTLPAFDGVSALKLAQEHAPDVPFLFVSGTLGEDVAIEALKKGATDYVLKTRLARLGPSITRALREAGERTQRKRAEEALRDSEEQWKAAFESNPVMYFMVDRTGTTLSVNAFGADQLGYKRSELVGQSVLNAFYEGDREQVWKDVENCFQNLGRTFKWEARKVRKDGTVIWVRETANALLLKNRPVLLVVCEDITDRKRAEEALRASEQLARSHVEIMMRSLDVLATEAAPEKFIAEILRIIGQRLRARRVNLWLRNPQDDSLRLHVMIENDKQVAPDPDHPNVKDRHAWMRNPHVQEMLLTKGPVICDDIEHDVRLDAELREYLTNKGRKRFLAIPMFVLGEVRGFIGIHHVEGRAYLPDEVELAQALAHHVMIAAHEAELGEQRRHAVILEERTRMARDIHDTLAQGFTGVIIQLDTAVEALMDEEPEAAVEHIGRARELARESLTEARRSVHALRPQALEEASFPDALKAIITNTTAGTSLQSDFQLKGEPRKLQSSVEENLLHIGQEALANALKHARATKFQARLSFDSEVVRLELCDNGQGFVVGCVNGRGIGLIGMKERAQQIGATLAVTSKPGKGTTIVAVSAYPAAVTT